MKITSDMPEAERKRYKLVRTDSLADVPGPIVTADEMTGECTVVVAGEHKQYNLGPRGIRIIPR